MQTIYLSLPLHISEIFYKDIQIKVVNINKKDILNSDDISREDISDD